MEIRNALQKIENYLTVVSNLNKTILSEGTMSRDELLLMKKYLYSSIDRIEDVESLLLIDHKENKSFIPTETVVENKFVPAKEKEIVEVPENDHIEEVEATLSVEDKEEMEDMVEDIHAEIESEKIEVIGEIKSVTEDVKNDAVAENKMEITPLIENIITEDYSLNRTEDKVELVAETKTESVPFVENIITEDYSLNRTQDKVELVNNDEKVDLVVSETKSFADSIITEDYTLNKLFENKNETKTESIIEETVLEKTSLIENIITEDYSLNRTEDKVELIAEEKVEVVAEKSDTPLVNTIVAETETLADKFEDETVTSFADALVSKQKDETSLFEKLEQKLNETPQPKLFEYFDDGKEELHETFSNNKSFTEPVNNTFDKSFTTSVYEQHDTVLVAEKEVETIVEQLTPSSLNQVLKPQTVADVLNKNTKKTLSESIALNDKFIFVRELFGNQFSEYEAALKHLDSLGNFTSVEQYCNNTLWNKFNWTERGSAAARFLEVLKKKFD